MGRYSIVSVMKSMLFTVQKASQLGWSLHQINETTPTNKLQLSKSQFLEVKGDPCPFSE